MKKELTPQQELFAQNVASGKNQSEAYRIAYPKSQKWKDEAVWAQASLLMSNSMVSVRIEELKAATVKRNEMTLDRVLKNMADWLDFDPLDLVDENDCVKSMKELSPEVRKSLSKIEVVELFAGSGGDRKKIGELKKITFHDKVKVADMFMKKFGAYIDNKNVKFDKESLEHLKDILDEIM